MKLRELPFIVCLATIACFGATALAVEDGLGTNVVKNLRVQPNGTLVIETGGAMTLGGEPIYDWNDLIMAITYESSAVDSALSNKITVLESATNAMNAAIGAEATTRANADTALQNNINTASNTLNGRINTVQGNLDTASNALNNAIGAEATTRAAMDTAISNAFRAADTVVSNALDAKIINVSNTVNTAKYDKIGGPISGAVNISGAVTLSNTVVYVPGAQSLSAAGDQIACNQAVNTISSTSDLVLNNGTPIFSGTSGQMLTLLCTGANSVTLTNNSDSVNTLVLANGVSFTMKANDALQLIFDGSKWIEVHRSDN